MAKTTLSVYVAKVLAELENGNKVKCYTSLKCECELSEEDYDILTDTIRPAYADEWSYDREGHLDGEGIIKKIIKVYDLDTLNWDLDE